ncbi:hypothetical protein A2U01_0083249, partial [Trifolium medium]|nr:hypothetical protein [Trifolium medium]
HAAENPPKKRSRKCPAQLEAVETAYTVLEHHEGEPAQAEHHRADDIEEGHYGDDIVRDMEEEMEREGDAAPIQIQSPAWVNPYEGQP